jgi:hypothetical protein
LCRKCADISGSSWTYLWLGHCRHSADPNNLGPIVSYTDPTVESLHDQKAWVKEDARLYGITTDNTRSIHRARDPHCTSAYAITFEGARRALFEIGLDHLNKPIDLELAKLTGQGKIPGLVVHPPLMGQWKTGTTKDSDIERNQSFTEEGHKGTSGPHVRMSIRRHLKELIYENS